MAKLLDAGTLSTNIRAKTGRTLNRLDSIRRSALQSFAKLEMRPVAGRYQPQRLNGARQNALGVLSSFASMPQPAASQQMEDRENQQTLQMGWSLCASSRRIT
jgi:hypothetical protein